jgi:hypothetical protein
MSKQHYHISTYKAQMSVGYLVKRAHSLMLDIMEPVIEQRGFTLLPISSRQRRAHPHHRPASRTRFTGTRPPRS